MRSEGSAALASGDLSGLSTLLRFADEPFRNSGEGLRIQAGASVIAGQACLVDGDWSCALEMGKRASDFGATGEGTNLRDQVAAAMKKRAEALTREAEETGGLELRLLRTKEALHGWASYGDLSKPPASVVLALERRRDRDQAALDRQVAVQSNATKPAASAKKQRSGERNNGRKDWSDSAGGRLRRCSAAMVRPLQVALAAIGDEVVVRIMAGFAGVVRIDD